MGFLDFLKKFSRREEEQEEKEPEEIKLAELGLWLDSHHKKISGSINSQLKEIKQKITEEKNTLKENIKNLEQAELKNKEIPERAKQLMEGNRRIYAQKINSLQNQTNLPDNLEKISGFSDSFDSYMVDFDKGVGKSHHVMEEFFPHEANAVLTNVRNLDKLVKETKQIIKSSQIQKINEIKAQFDSIQSKIKQKDETKKKIKFEKENLQVGGELLEEKEAKLKEIENKDSYKETLELIGKKESLEKQIQENKSQQTHSFSEIEAALKKYHNLSENKLVKKYLDNPLIALSEDRELGIISILSATKIAIDQGEIGLKEKKKDKILQELNKLDRDHFETFLTNHDNLNKDFKELTSQIENSEVLKELNKIKAKLAQDKTSLEENKSKIEKLERDFEETDINSLKFNLEREITTTLNKQIKII